MVARNPICPHCGRHVNDRLGIALKAFRERRGWSQEEMCALLGTEQGTYSRMESGKQPLSDARVDEVIKNLERIIILLEEADGE